MEDAHLVACRAVALVEADGGRVVDIVAESGRWKGQKYDVPHAAAVTGAMIGAAGWRGRRSIGGR